MPVSNQWCIAVFKCNPNMVKKVLVEVYRFTDNLKGVRSLHFLVRDRVEDEVVFSFRVMVEPKFKEIVKSKLAYKLSTLLSEDKYVLTLRQETFLSSTLLGFLKRELPILDSQSSISSLMC